MSRSMLITGGAGFIGSNATRYFATRGWTVTVLDNLSRGGAEANLVWLRREVPFELERVDVRDRAAVERIVARLRPDAVLHLAAQVAVTTSVADPRADFEVNAVGTFNLLEAVRAFAPTATFVYASSNKVYGRMEDEPVALRGERYELERAPAGIPEERPLDFHSPYGCSKGAADQYALDYARIYGLRSTVFRQSCIYGERQFGEEEQGWVAWFAIAAMTGRPITLFGDGFQVRDVLHVEDLLRAYEAVLLAPRAAAGQAFNLGGGPEMTLSLRELLAMLRGELGVEPAVASAPSRPGDQPVFVCCTAKARRLLGWSPRIPPRAGVARLVEWIGANWELLSPVAPLDRARRSA